MVILDFYGMPGSGKSTISHMLAEQIREKGYSVIEPSWTLDNKESSIKRILKKLLLAVAYEICHPLVIKKTMGCAGSNGTSAKQQFKLWVNLAYTMNYESRKKGADFMIMDEGIAQGIVSLFTGASELEYDKCYSYLKNKIYSTITFVYINIDTETALQRLEKRGTKKSRVDQLSSEVKIKMLESIENICDCLNIPKIVISNDKREDACDQLLKLLF